MLRSAPLALHLVIYQVIEHPLVAPLEPAVLHPIVLALEQLGDVASEKMVAAALWLEPGDPVATGMQAAAAFADLCEMALPVPQAPPSLWCHKLQRSEVTWVHSRELQRC